MSIEWIKDQGQTLAIIISAAYRPTQTEFITPGDYKQQVGFVVYKAGEMIRPHQHKSLPRNILGTSEVLVVKSGKVEVYLYNAERKIVETRILGEGDVIVLVSGGHGFKVKEDVVLLEIKQGPYIGVEEKERFDS